MTLKLEQLIAQTARDLGINVNALQPWIGKYSKPKVTSTRMDEHIYDEVKRLKKELAVAIQERDLLKKTTAYFAREIR